MRLNTPITDEQRAAAEQEYERVAKNNKKFILEAADKIEKGEPLSDFKCSAAMHPELAREIVAAVLRGAANDISLTRPRPSGRPSTIQDDFIAIYLIGKNSFPSENNAIEYYAEEYGVTTTAIKKKLGQAGTKQEKMVAKDEIDRWKKLLGIKT